MRKIIFIICILLAGIAFGVDVDNMCSDGTIKYECSSESPGYVCAQNGDVLELQNVIGQVYPSDYPKADLAGEPTDLAKKCACANFEGYVEQNGKCVNPSDTSTYVEPEAPVANTAVNNAPVANSAQNASVDAQNSTTTGQNVNQQANAGSVAPLLNVPKVEEKKEEPPADGGILGIFGWVLVISIIGAGFVGVVLVIAGVSLFKLGRKGEGLGGV